MKGYDKITLKTKEGYLNSDKNTGKIFFDNILTDEEANILYKNLLEETEWEQGIYKMYGKEVKTPRLLWAMKDKDFDIEESYNITGSSIWSKEVKKIKKKVEKIINKKIKYEQINYYRNGDDHIGWHTDSEVVEGDLIASLSLGATRKFQFMSVDKNNDNKYEIDLNNGSLIVFDYNAAKKDWKHRIPKQSKIEEGRINVTFRLR